MLCLTVARLSLLIAIAAQADVPTENAFTISGRVTKPDGSPAAGASVTVESNWPNVPIEPPISIRCDADGAFRGLTSRFGFTTIIHTVVSVAFLAYRLFRRLGDDLNAEIA